MSKHRQRSAVSLTDRTPEEEALVTRLREEMGITGNAPPDPNRENAIIARLRELSSHLAPDGSALFHGQEEQPERLEPLVINLPPNEIWRSGNTMTIAIAASLADLVEKGVRTGEATEHQKLTPKARNTERDAEIIRLRKEDPRKWSRKKLAGRFKVSQGTIKQVLYRARKEGKL
jgi:hypothetical protein